MVCELQYSGCARSETGGLLAFTGGLLSNLCGVLRFKDGTKIVSEVNVK